MRLHCLVRQRLRIDLGTRAESSSWQGQPAALCATPETRRLRQLGRQRKRQSSVNLRYIKPRPLPDAYGRVEDRSIAIKLTRRCRAHFRAKSGERREAICRAHRVPNGDRAGQHAGFVDRHPRAPRSFVLSAPIECAGFASSSGNSTARRRPPLVTSLRSTCTIAFDVGKSSLSPSLADATEAGGDDRVRRRTVARHAAPALRPQETASITAHRPAPALAAIRAPRRARTGQASARLSAT